VQTSLQQTPCWQRSELQSSAIVQVLPSGFLPQLPPLQTLPAPQSALVRQLVRQAFPTSLSQT
jgi:hypothetical protein